MTTERSDTALAAPSRGTTRPQEPESLVRVPFLVRGRSAASTGRTGDRGVLGPDSRPNSARQYTPKEGKTI